MPFRPPLFAPFAFPLALGFAFGFGLALGFLATFTGSFAFLTSLATIFLIGFDFEAFFAGDLVTAFGGAGFFGFGALTVFFWLSDRFLAYLASFSFLFASSLAFL